MAHQIARMDELESRAWMNLTSVAQLLPAALDAQLQRDAGLTHFEFVVLSVLRLQGTPELRAKQIAEATNSTLPRLSHVLSRLEKRRLVARSACEDDRRATNVTLTTEGRALLIRAMPEHLATIRTLVLDHLSRSELEQLADITGTIRSRLDPNDRFLHASPRDNEPVA